MTNLFESSATRVRAYTVRKATESDLPAILDIYNDVVLTSTATFDLEARTLAQQKEWLRDHQAPYLALVAANGDQVVGWASLSQFRPRPGYRFTAESSVYVHRDHRRHGIGTLLMERLLAMARTQGFHSVVVFIDAGNVASLKLHKHLGFRHVGTYKEVGHKFNSWLDMVHMQRLLSE